MIVPPRVERIIHTCSTGTLYWRRNNKVDSIIYRISFTSLFRVRRRKEHRTIPYKCSVRRKGRTVRPLLRISGPLPGLGDPGLFRRMWEVVTFGSTTPLVYTLRSSSTSMDHVRQQFLCHVTCLWGYRWSYSSLTPRVTKRNTETYVVIERRRD